MKLKRTKCQIFSRVVDYWNPGKQSEFEDRLAFKLNKGNREEL